MIESIYFTGKRRLYGGIELVRSYRQNLRRGLELAIGLHLVIFGGYWGVRVVEHAESPTPAQRIARYEELPTAAGIGEREFGLKSYPIVLTAENLRNEKPSSTPPSRGVVTRRERSRPRAMGLGIGDLPSVKPNDKINANSLAPETPADYSRNDPVGGRLSDDLNTIRGGTVVASREGDPPSGLGASGVGSAAKPAPGLYGVGGRGGSDLFGNGEGGGVGFSMKWLQGGMRKKISGDLPKYPEGAKVEAEIRLLAIVSPDGSVQALQPAQKGNTRLEEAAMKEVRYWKFEPLKSSQPQVTQRCEIVFLFTLK
jgi:TonB family protein